MHTKKNKMMMRSKKEKLAENMHDVDVCEKCKDNSKVNVCCSKLIKFLLVYKEQGRVDKKAEEQIFCKCKSEMLNDRE